MCLERSTTNLGSSRTYPPTIDLNVAGGAGSIYDAPWGMLSDDPAINPSMYTHTFVFLPYCDGGSQVGDVDVAVPVGNASVYYRGARIRAATAHYLLNQVGLSAATDVVLSGGSAGALATYLHADAWAAAITAASPSAKVVALPDSGFFLDYSAPKGGSYHDDLVWVSTAMNGTGALPAACVAAHAADPSACIFAENVVPTLKTPTFALQGTYDAYQIAAELHANPKSPGNYSEINAYGATLASTLQTRLLDPSTVHGAFLDSCYHHTRYWGNITIEGDVQATAFAAWYASIGTPGAKRAWVQGQTYPCDACCHNGK